MTGGQLAIVIAADYLGTWWLYGWRLSLRFIAHEIQHAHDTFRGYPDIVASHIADERPDNIFAAYVVALFWPVTAPVRGVYRIVDRFGDGRMFDPDRF